MSSWPGILNILDDFTPDSNHNRDNEPILYISGAIRQLDFRSLAIHFLKFSKERRANFDIWSIAPRARRSKLVLSPNNQENQRRILYNDEVHSKSTLDSKIPPKEKRKSENNGDHGESGQQAHTTDLPKVVDVDAGTVDISNQKPSQKITGLLARGTISPALYGEQLSQKVLREPLNTTKAIEYDSDVSRLINVL